MTLPDRMKFGIFMAPFHWAAENPTLSFERDMELLEWLDQLGYDEAWIGEHHSGGWETIASPEIFIGAAAQRTKHIKLGTGVLSLPYHHPLMVANRMIQLDHMTRGRVMMGVGPGALVGDAFMLGIDPPLQRQRMDEALNIILRLWTETDPITYEADWFTLKGGHRTPSSIYSAPYPRRRGRLLLSRGNGLRRKVRPRRPLPEHHLGPRRCSPDLAKFWDIAEETADKYGNTVSRDDWGIVIHVHLAESRKEAMEQAREASGRYQKEYFEDTLGLPTAYDGPQDKIIDHMVATNNWCVGTPDDLVETINRLEEESGGFGRLLIQATEWGTREQVLHSYELLARYVMPRFQGSVTSLHESREWSVKKREELVALNIKAMDKAKADYVKNVAAGP